MHNGPLQDGSYIFLANLLIPSLSMQSAPGPGPGATHQERQRMHERRLAIALWTSAAEKNNTNCLTYFPEPKVTAVRTVDPFIVLFRNASTPTPTPTQRAMSVPTSTRQWICKNNTVKLKYVDAFTFCATYISCCLHLSVSCLLVIGLIRLQYKVFTFKKHMHHVFQLTTYG